MLTAEFVQSFANLIIGLFILSMLKLKFGTNTEIGKALHFITGTAN